MTQSTPGGWLVLSAVLAMGCGGADDSNAEPGPGSGGAAGGVSPVGSSGGSTTGAAGSTTGAGGAPGVGGSSDTGAAGTGKGGSAGSGGMGGSTATDGGSHSGVTDGGSHGGTSSACKIAPTAGVPSGAPALTPGVWRDITPAQLVGYKGTNQTMIAQGIALDPCNLATVYWCTTPFDIDKGGLFKSTDAGSSWTRIAKVKADNGADHLDEPLHVRVDPGNPLHLYAGDGVRGATNGFWVSQDGGETFVMPAAWVSIAKEKQIFINDVYDVAVDPTDFKHVLTSFHGAWAYGSATYGNASGVMESKDGGETWIAHDPNPSWGTGHAINFLYAPELGIGDSQTWLLGTQGNGSWRTADSGKTWTKVNDNGIFHGGGDIFYNKAGVLFASGSPKNMRSTDNGVTWALTGPGNSTGIMSDGKVLYTAPALGDNPYFTSPEADGTTFTPFEGGAQMWHNGGPFEMTFDAVNGIMYSSNWEQGAMALKVK